MTREGVESLLSDLERRIGARSVFIEIRGCPAVLKTGNNAGRKCLKGIPAKGDKRSEAERIRTYLKSLNEVTDKDLLLQNVRNYLLISFCGRHSKKASSEQEWDNWVKLVHAYTPTTSNTAAGEIIVLSDDDADSSGIQEDDVFDGDRSCNTATTAGLTSEILVVLDDNADSSGIQEDDVSNRDLSFNITTAAGEIIVLSDDDADSSGIHEDDVSNRDLSFNTATAAGLTSEVLVVSDDDADSSGIQEDDSFNGDLSFKTATAVGLTSEILTVSDDDADSSDIQEDDSFNGDLSFKTATAAGLTSEILVVSDDDADSSDIQEDDTFDEYFSFDTVTPETTVDIDELEKKVATFNVQDSRASSPTVNFTDPSPDDGATADIADELSKLDLAWQTPPPSGASNTIPPHGRAGDAGANSSAGLTNQDEGDPDLRDMGIAGLRREGSVRDYSVLHHKFYEAFKRKDTYEGIVYVFQKIGRDDRFKVGYSGNSGNARKKQPNNCYAACTEIIYETQGGRFVGAHRVEALVHAMLRHCNIEFIKCNGKDDKGNDCTAKHREWFATDQATVVGITRAMERFVREGGYERRETGEYHVSEAGDKVVKKLLGDCSLATLKRALDVMEARRSATTNNSIVFSLD